MTSVLRELPLSYAVLSEGRRCGSPAAVHEPSPAGRNRRTGRVLSAPGWQAMVLPIAGWMLAPTRPAAFRPKSAKTCCGISQPIRAVCGRAVVRRDAARAMAATSRSGARPIYRNSDIAGPRLVVYPVR